MTDTESRRPPRRERPAGGDEHVLDDWREDPWDASNGVSEVELLRQPRGVGRSVMYITLALAMVAVLAVGVYGWRYVERANPSGEAGAPVQFLVEDGDTLQSISERLQSEGLIDDASFFRSYVGDKGGLEVVPGRYVIRPRDHVGNVLARLRRPPGETIVRVTFPEGFTVAQMGARLEANENLPQFSAADFEAAANSAATTSRFRPPGQTSLEGLLFPATYEVSNADDATAVVNRMVFNLEDRVATQIDLEARAARIGRSPYEVLIIASMIEREARTDQDRPLIARVIYNRLDRGQRLGIDATALYQNPVVDPSNLVPGDIDRAIANPTPWNTFTIDGLPPTPIANPGRASIEAALNPAPPLSPGDSRCDGVAPGDCALIYYVIADQQGNHVFSVTEAQFNADRQRAADAGLLGVGPAEPEESVPAGTGAPVATTTPT